MSKKQISITSILTVVMIYLLFLPYPTAELTVRRHVFFSLQPIKAFRAQVVGTGSSSFGGAELYYVNDVSKSYIWVKKNELGYRVVAEGSGP